MKLGDTREELRAASGAIAGGDREACDAGHRDAGQPYEGGVLHRRWPSRKAMVPMPAT